MSRILLKLTKIANPSKSPFKAKNIIFTAACSIYPWRKVLKSALFVGPNPVLKINAKIIDKNINLVLFDLPLQNNEPDEFELKLNIHEVSKRVNVWKNLIPFDNLYLGCDKLNYNGLLHPNPEKQLSAFVPQLISRAVSHLKLSNPKSTYTEDSKTFGEFADKIKNGYNFIIKFNNLEFWFEWQIVSHRYVFETLQFECKILNEYDDEIYCNIKADDCLVNEGFPIKQFLKVGDISEKNIVKSFSGKIIFQLLEADSGITSYWDRDDLIGEISFNPEKLINERVIDFSGEEGAYKITYSGLMME